MDERSHLLYVMKLREIKGKPFNVGALEEMEDRGVIKLSGFPSLETLMIQTTRVPAPDPESSHCRYKKNDEQSGEQIEVQIDIFIERQLLTEKQTSSKTRYVLVRVKYEGRGYWLVISEVITHGLLVPEDLMSPDGDVLVSKKEEVSA